MDTSLSADVTDRRHARQRVEATLFSLEADRSRLLRQRDELAAFLQSLRRKLKQAEQEVEGSEQDLHTLEASLLEKEHEIDQEKKKLRLL